MMFYSGAALDLVSRIHKDTWGKRFIQKHWSIAAAAGLGWASGLGLESGANDREGKLGTKKRKSLIFTAVENVDD